MSEWATFIGVITVKNKVNLSKILQYAPIGSEGGLLLYKSELHNTFIINHSLRDVKCDDTLKDYLDLWISKIKPLILEFSLTIKFKSNHSMLFYVMQDENTIINSNVEI